MASHAQATQFDTTFTTMPESRRRTITDAIARVVTYLRQVTCGLSGHDMYLHVDGPRVTMRCVGCQHETPGWETGGRAYQLTYAGDPTRHRLR